MRIMPTTAQQRWLLLLSRISFSYIINTNLPTGSAIPASRFPPSGVGNEVVQPILEVRAIIDWVAE
jgi:hypothetical protein